MKFTVVILWYCLGVEWSFICYFFKIYIFQIVIKLSFAMLSFLFMPAAVSFFCCSTLLLIFVCVAGGLQPGSERRERRLTGRSERREKFVEVARSRSGMRTLQKGGLFLSYWRGLRVIGFLELLWTFQSILTFCGRKIYSIIQINSQLLKNILQWVLI